VQHTYFAHLVWTGNAGTGTSSYTDYLRDYRVRMAGKPDLLASADPVFRGTAGLHNPEDLFLSAIAACHMLSYLALCARQGVCVLAYEDHASGTMTTRADGGGAFDGITLSPMVRLADQAQQIPARQLHAGAHARCFIANSCRVPIRVQPDLT
jgi:organic hydroperoxide reductase OsmC/OhrA